eukprot:jgi/Mesvir1/13318/Mv23092-RA.1
MKLLASATALMQARVAEEVVAAVEARERQRGMAAVAEKIARALQQEEEVAAAAARRGMHARVEAMVAHEERLWWLPAGRNSRQHMLAGGRALMLEMRTAQRELEERQRQLAAQQRRMEEMEKEMRVRMEAAAQALRRAEAEAEEAEGVARRRVEAATREAERVAAFRIAAVEDRARAEAAMLEREVMERERKRMRARVRERVDTEEAVTVARERGMRSEARDIIARLMASTQAGASHQRLPWWWGNPPQGGLLGTDAGIRVPSMAGDLHTSVSLGGMKRRRKGRSSPPQASGTKSRKHAFKEDSALGPLDSALDALTRGSLDAKFARSAHARAESDASVASVTVSDGLLESLPSWSHSHSSTLDEAEAGNAASGGGLDWRPRPSGAEQGRKDTQAAPGSHRVDKQTSGDGPEEMCSGGRPEGSSHISSSGAHRGYGDKHGKAAGKGKEHHNRGHDDTSPPRTPVRTKAIQTGRAAQGVIRAMVTATTTTIAIRVTAITIPHSAMKSISAVIREGMSMRKITTVTSPSRHQKASGTPSRRRAGKSWQRRGHSLSDTEQDNERDGGDATPVADAESVVRRVRRFMAQQKALIQERQGVIEEARGHWRRDMDALEEVEDASERQRRATVLKETRRILEAQAAQVNAETRLLREVYRLVGRLQGSTGRAGEDLRGMGPGLLSASRKLPALDSMFGGGGAMVAQLLQYGAARDGANELLRQHSEWLKSFRRTIQEQEAAIGDKGDTAGILAGDSSDGGEASGLLRGVVGERRGLDGVPRLYHTTALGGAGAVRPGNTG